MSGPAKNGALIYASDVEQVAHFYEHCFSMQRIHSTPQLVVLSGEAMQLVIHERPADMPAALTGDDIQPSAIKLFFTVNSIDEATAKILGLGGQVLPERWPGPLFDTINIADPEGNLQHVRETHESTAAQ